MTSLKGTVQHAPQGKELGSADDSPSSQPLLLTVPQAAQQMHVSPAMVYKLILTDGLPTVKLGRATRIVYSSLVDWLREREHEQRAYI